MHHIFLYSDEGVCPTSLRATFRALKDNTNVPIDFVKRDFFLSEDWETKTSLIVFPGGRDVFYMKALQGEPNRRIRDYVRNGGRYFGVCAGAYYASASINFEKGGSFEVIEPRELHFFPGEAVGPALGLGEFHYKEQKGAKDAHLILSKQHFPFEEIRSYYHGGCTFVQAHQFPNIEILAEYAELKDSPAIILSKIDQGVALLSGIHPEYIHMDAKRKKFFSLLLSSVLKR